MVHGLLKEFMTEVLAIDYLQITQITQNKKSKYSPRWMAV
jgi:hypothetical protein